jgi:hypothetical protein
LVRLVAIEEQPVGQVSILEHGDAGGYGIRLNGELKHILGGCNNGAAMFAADTTGEWIDTAELADVDPGEAAKRQCQGSASDAGEFSWGYGAKADCS